MLKHIFNRITRRPLTAVAIVLFTATLTVSLCFLNHIKMEERQSFEESYASVPVFFKVTDLDGSRVQATGGINGWIVDLFSDSLLTPNLSPYVSEIHTRVSYTDKAFWVYQVYDEKRDKMKDYYDPVTVTGITSTHVAEELTAGYGGKICWNDGYDESVLTSDEFICIVPEELQNEQELDLNFQYDYTIDLRDFHREATRTFKIVGHYTDPGNSTIYIPYTTMEWVYTKLIRSKEVEEVGATLNDNDSLEQLRKTASYWFAEPNPSGAQTPWGRFDYDYYLYALDIDDNMLRNLESDMKNSMRINQIASTVVFMLSACAGFLTGFLVVRSNKHEISLMRTLGASQGAIFLELSLEQLACVVLGILLGGGYSLWQSIGQLLLFGAIYAVGLTVALLIFLRKNLLTTIKEDE